MTDELHQYIVTFKEDGYTFVFKCSAENKDHAREQCENAYPKATVVKVSRDSLMSDDQIIEKARNEYEELGGVNIDTKPTVLRDVIGAYVQAWVWVEYDEGDES